MINDLNLASKNTSSKTDRTYSSSTSSTTMRFIRIKVMFSQLRTIQPFHPQVTSIIQWLMHPEVHEAILQVFPQFPPLLWSLLLPGKVRKLDLSLANTVYHIVIINQYPALSISMSIIYHDHLWSFLLTQTICGSAADELSCTAQIVFRL